MDDNLSPAYPGSAASAWQILNLAHEFRGSCLHLMARSHGSESHQLAPARVLAIHAIELYLNALMLDAGETPQSVRGLQHDLGARAKRAGECGLVLRQRTADHLHRLTTGREYLTARYGPELSGTLSQLNRLTATLEEVAHKVTDLVNRRIEARFASRASA
jgi:hypothetical protein